MKPEAATEIGKKSLLKAIFSKNMLICALNGFTAGLPLFFLWQMVPAWLRDQGVDLTAHDLLDCLVESGREHQLRTG